MLPQLIGGGLGLVSGLFGAASERDKQEKEGKIRAAEIQASPWTHVAPSQNINFAGSTLGKGIAGAGAGLGLAQSLSNASTASPWASMGQGTAPQTAANMFGVSSPEEIAGEQAPTLMGSFNRPSSAWGLLGKKG